MDNEDVSQDSDDAPTDAVKYVWASVSHNRNASKQFERCQQVSSNIQSCDEEGKKDVAEQNWVD